MHKQPVYNELYKLRYENENGAFGTKDVNENENCVVCYEGPKSAAYMRKNEVCEEVFKVGFCLPAGPYVTDEDVHYIVDCIKEAIDM